MSNNAVNIIKPTGKPFLGIICKVTNKLNGMVYIGQSQQSLIKRKYKHIYEANNGCSYYFHNALRKYGIDNFKWEVICICPNLDSLNEQEQYYIAFYDSMNTGYNLTSGGLNYKRSEETKEKLRKINVGRFVSQVTKEKLRQTNLGHSVSDETKAKISKAHLGKKLSGATKQKMSEAREGANNPMFGHTHTDESRKKMSETNSGKNHPMWGKKHTKETIKKMEQLKKGKNHPMYSKHHSEKTKEKMRDAVKNRLPVSDETRQRMRASRLKYLTEQRND